MLFRSDLDAGKYDPVLNESEQEPTSPISPLKDGKDENELADSSNLESTIKTETKKEDDDFTNDPDDENVDNDISKVEANGKSLVDDLRPLKSDELTILPEGNQVMIRTIPPDIGRVKLEAVSCLVCPCASLLICFLLQGYERYTWYHLSRSG